MSPQEEKPLIWIGSRKDLQMLPKEVQRFFGFALDFAQREDKHDDDKVLTGFGDAGVLEVVEDDIGCLHRPVCRGIVRASRFPEEEQARYHHPKGRYGYYQKIV